MFFKHALGRIGDFHPLETCAARRTYNEKEPEYLIRFFFIIFDIKDTIIYLSQIIFHNFHVVFRESDQLQINIITILTYYIFHCLD